LLRSVVVMKYVVDAQGNLVKSELLRSNHDGETEKTALNTLRNSVPFPRPASHLLRHGRIEISETWLFNNDGRFQLRTIAEPQMDS
jgi:protein TonB